MHMIFTEEEKEWIVVQKMKWTVKKGCPKEIRDSILKKLEIIDNQKAGEAYGRKIR